MNVRSLSVLLALVASAAASAVPITYTLNTTVSGLWNGTSFQDAATTLTSTSDTSLVTFAGGVYRAPGATTITVAGFGSAVLQRVSASGTPDARGEGLYGTAGFSLPGGGAVMYVIGPELLGADLRRSFGPFSGDLGRGTGTFQTSVGTVSFSGSSGPSTFTAQAVPEPASMATLGLGAAALLRRRKRA